MAPVVILSSALASVSETPWNPSVAQITVSRNRTVLEPMRVPSAGTGVGADPSECDQPEAPAATCAVACATANVELGCGLPFRSNPSPARTPPLATNATCVSASVAHAPSASPEQSRSESAAPERLDAALQAAAPVLRFAPWIAAAADPPASVSASS